MLPAQSLSPQAKLYLEQQKIALQKLNQDTNTDIIGYSIGKLLLTAFWAYLGYLLIIPPNNLIILDYANIIIHECGHFLIQFFQIFIFGDSQTIKFIAVAGGTGAQMLAPIFVTIYFLFKKAWYSAFFGIFWLGDNLIMNSSYIADARCLCLPSLWSMFGIEGATHDWNYMLGKMGLLEHDILISKIEKILGVTLIIFSLILMLGNIFSNLKTVFRPKSSNV